jgi:small GTP-binding protein
MSGRGRGFSQSLLAETDGEPDEIVKLVLIGDSGVGKTNLLQQFVRHEFLPDSTSTIAGSFATKTVQACDKTVKAQIWDTAGQERYRAVNSSYYNGAMGALLLYDITYSLSFRNVEQWIKELRNHAGPIPVMLVGNKSDLVDKRSITVEEGMKLAESQQLLFIEASALDATNVAEAFTMLITEIVSHHSGAKLGGADRTPTLKAGERIDPDKRRGCC